MARHTGAQAGYGFLLPKLSKALYKAASKLEPETKKVKPPKVGLGAGNRRLSDEQVAEMRKLWETDRANWTHQKLADKFGITKGGACSIVNYNVRAKASDGSWLK